MNVTESLAALGTFLGSVWDMLSGVTVPGLGVSFAALFLAIMIANVVLAVCSVALGVGRGSTGYRSGRGRKSRISENRQGDEF